MVEGTRQTFNHGRQLDAVSTDTLLRDVHLLPDPYTADNLHDDYRPEGGNTHTVKPLRAEQYVSVLYVVDAAGQRIVRTPEANMVGSSWVDAVAGKSDTLRVECPFEDLYATLERTHQVPMTNLFSFDAMETLWETDGAALESLMYGDLLSKNPALVGANFSGLSHAPGNSTYQLTGPVMFGVSFN
jgi:hypothetical protein